MGCIINMVGNEKFLYIDQDILYFFLDYYLGMGGLDIFKIYKKFNGCWFLIKNFCFLLNLGGDDFGLIIDYKVKKLGDLF